MTHDHCECIRRQDRYQYEIAREEMAREEKSKEEQFNDPQARLKFGESGG